MEMSIEKLKNMVMARLIKAGIACKSRDRICASSSYIILTEYLNLKFNENVEIRFSNHNAVYRNSLSFEFVEIKYNTIKVSKSEITIIVNKIKYLLKSKKIASGCSKHYSIKEVCSYQEKNIRFGQGLAA